jgi:hypothetical protein
MSRVFQNTVEFSNESNRIWGGETDFGRVCTPQFRSRSFRRAGTVALTGYEED